MIRVLVADDSATSRTLLVELLSAEPDFKVIGEATNGQEAVEMAQRLAPDLITMDVQMPVMDGLEATKQIMVRSPRPIIIISHTARDDEVGLSLEATRAGALMVLPKPDGPLSPRFASDRRQIVSMARAMSQAILYRYACAPRGIHTRIIHAYACSARFHPARCDRRVHGRTGRHSDRSRRPATILSRPHSGRTTYFERVHERSRALAVRRHGAQGESGGAR
jgi:chemotaxis response regulator CheB